MTATLEQTQADLLELVKRVQQGEEVVITNQGQAVAKLTRLPESVPSPGRRAWLETLRRLRESTGTGKTGLTVEQILDEDRGD